MNVEEGPASFILEPLKSKAVRRRAAAGAARRPRRGRAQGRGCGGDDPPGDGGPPAEGGVHERARACARGEAGAGEEAVDPKAKADTGAPTTPADDAASPRPPRARRRGDGAGRRTRGRRAAGAACRRTWQIEYVIVAVSAPVHPAAARAPTMRTEPKQRPPARLHARRRTAPLGGELGGGGSSRCGAPDDDTAAAARTRRRGGRRGAAASGAATRRAAARRGGRRCPSTRRTSAASRRAPPRRQNRAIARAGRERQVGARALRRRAPDGGGDRPHSRLRHRRRRGAERRAPRRGENLLGRRREGRHRRACGLCRRRRPGGGREVALLATSMVSAHTCIVDALTGLSLGWCLTSFAGR